MQPWKKNLYTVWVTQFLSLLGFGFGLPFLPFYIQDLGITDPAAVKIWTGWLTSAPAIALAVMAPVWGLLADKIGKKIMLIRAMLGAMLVLTGMGLAQSAWTVLIFRMLQGLLTGTVTSSSALVASGTPDKHMSYALGFLSSSTFIGYSLGPAAGGLIAEHFGYRMSFFIGTGIVCIGLVLVLLFIEEPSPLMAGNHLSEEGSTPDVKDKTSQQEKSLSKTGIFSSFTIMLFVLFFFIRISRVMPTPFIPLYIQDLRGTIEGSARISGLLSGGLPSRQRFQG